MSSATLIEYLTITRDAYVRQTLESWMNCSDAFHAFVEKYKDKIRAKMRAAQNDEDIGDILWELQVGYLLLTNADLSVEYEPYGTGSRGPRLRS